MEIFLGVKNRLFTTQKNNSVFLLKLVKRLNSFKNNISRVLKDILSNFKIMANFNPKTQKMIFASQNFIVKFLNNFTVKFETRKLKPINYMHIHTYFKAFLS
jgi:hypothetical protein